MEKTRDEAVDGTMTGLLLMGFPFNIGIPCWAVNEMIHRYEQPLQSDDILGISDDFHESSMLSEYSDMKGYEFSWGTLSEDLDQFEDDDKASSVGRFEFCLKEVLLAFPQSAMIEDLFVWMYENHPLQNNKYACDETCGDWFVLSFVACGQEEISQLRRWLAYIFIPKILPDLITEAMMIVAAAKERELAHSGAGSFERLFIETKRYQLCGDPSELTFNRKTN